MIQFQIPDEALNQLRTLLEQDGEMQWQIGQFIVDYWQEMLKYVKQDEVREAHAELIRQLARGTGADRSTLRDREKMRLFFTDDDLARFPVFTYHQWRALRSAGERWLEFAERANDENWSVAKIRAEIKGKPTLAEVTLKRLGKIEDAARKIMDDQEVPDYVRESLILIPTIVADTKELIPHE
jgi:hypothetical protein